MGSFPFAKEPAVFDPRYKTDVVDRFLRYVRFDTQSDESSKTFPSTEKQLVLLRLLKEELTELGLDEVEMDSFGYVFATIPATPGSEAVPTFGLIAHVDTSPEMSGADVKPIVHESWDGTDIVLPDVPDLVLRRAENQHLEEQLGEDIITASGTTLLGADNKAGVAEIVAAAGYLIAHPEIEHGRIRIGFTPDEEIGHGADHFDVERFGACCAYTMDGETLGELQWETFSADALTVTFRGSNCHPGFAEGKLVNALKIAGAFLTRLPHEFSPEGTSGRTGFVHAYGIEGGVEETRIRMILRDFETAQLDAQATLVEEAATAAVSAYPGGAYELERTEQYRNMKEVLDGHPEVVENAREAIRRTGLDLRESSIRGGTDGSRLSFMGLPTPNVFAGEHNFHSRLEWISVRDMHKAVEVIVELARVWKERA
jgi:tripeptide aminopeptidase